MDRVVLTGLVVLRWAALGWMGAVLAVSNDDLGRPWLALTLVGAALAFTVLATSWLRSTPSQLLLRPVLVAELVIAVALVISDGWAYGPGHAFSTSQSLGSIWPLAAVLSIGLAAGASGGAAAGALLGLARLGGSLANGVRSFDGGQVLSLINTGVLYVVAGAVAGHVVHLLRRAEREISASRGARGSGPQPARRGVADAGPRPAVARRRSGAPGP